MSTKTKWVMAFSFFLILSLMVFGVLSAQGNKKATKTAMDVEALAGGCFNSNDPFLYSGNTATNPSFCPNGGALIPSNNRDFFTNLQRCIDPITLPGEDGTQGNDDDIFIVKSGLNAIRDNSTGLIVAIKIGLTDDEGNSYSTGQFNIMPVFPDPSGFTIIVCQDLVLKAHKRGKKTVVGAIKVGHIVYLPK